MTVDNKNCRNCAYFHGSYDESCCCNYLLTTGKRRPCPPGAGCTVKVKRKLLRKIRGDQHRDGNLRNQQNGLR